MKCYLVVNAKCLNTEEAAEWHAQERARLSLIGKTPPFVDGQIAAIAKAYGLIIVTVNVSYYEFFEEIFIEFSQDVFVVITIRCTQHCWSVP